MIKGIGSSSDGRARGLTAPVVDGQTRALDRAYAKAGISPATVGYVEAHGTGTALGDVVEIEALGKLFRQAGARPRECVVGSVKSSIGHTKCAAGLAGLINASLALHHKVLPPTIGVEKPNPKLDLHDGPLRLCTEAQPWLHDDSQTSRRAGVSAFGFGGTNFHAVLEAYDHNLATPPEATMNDWPAELLVWQASDQAQLLEPLDHLAAALDSGASPSLRDLAHTLIQAREKQSRSKEGDLGATLVIVASDHRDLRDKIKLARTAIAEGNTRLDDPRGIVFEAQPPWAGQPLAYLFPGQGAQAPGMLRELAVIFPEVRGAFEEIDRALRERSLPAVGPFIFPPPAHGEAATEETRRALMQTEVAQPAVGAACVGMLRLLERLGCQPDMVGGHSYGELVALHAAGALSTADLAELSTARGRFMREAGQGVAGAMAALLAGPGEVEPLTKTIPGVLIANWNGPRQTVIAGPSDAVKRAIEHAEARGIRCRLLPVSSAFHTPLVAPARLPLSHLASRLLTQAPDRPVYSNLDAAPHPSDTAAIGVRLGDHLASPVRFAEMIEAMHHDGARVFVEVGPGSILAPLVDTILKDRPHLAVSCDPSGASGVTGFLRTVGRLVVAGCPLRLSSLTEGRSAQILDLRNLPPGDFPAPPTTSTWVVNGSRARPIAEPEQPRLGQALPESRRVQVKPAMTPVVEPRKTASPNGFHGAQNGTPGVPPLTKPIVGRSTSSRGERATVPVSDPIMKRSFNPGSQIDMKTPSAPATSTDRVIESFQQTMQAFLEVQKATMLAYLAGRSAPGLPVPATAGAGEQDHHVEHNGASNVSPPAGFKAPESVPERAPATRPAVVVDVAAAESFVLQRHELNRGHGNGNGSGHGNPNGNANGNGKAHVLPPPPSGTTGGPDRATITARLLETVRDRTGYPIETLGLELDMEADLGIDSIKRVEILGKMRDEFPGLKALSDAPEMMDAMARARTLGVIVDRIASLSEQSQPAMTVDASASPSQPVPAPSANGSSHGHGKHGRNTSRRILKVVDAPLPRERAGLMANGRIVITDDGRGVARRLETELVSAGVDVERIGGPEAPVDWTSPAAIESVLEQLRLNGPLAGMIHALPLGDTRSTQPIDGDWSARIGVEVKGLFSLAKAMAGDLETAVRQGGACLIAATAMGGRFASEGSTHSDFFPGHGGIAGLTKTLAREWPAIRTRVVDFAASDAIGSIAGRLVSEVFARDGWAEVGYDQGRRIRLKTAESALETSASTLELKPGEPVLISGGARGITALAAIELARLWRPTLLILGTTPLPTAGESSETRGLIHEAEIKTALYTRLRKEGRTGGPAEIEASYQALRRAREIRENLEILRQTGATVEYAQGDVRDPAAMARVLDDWRGRHGEVAGLIHGAGLIKDKLIRQKSIESFDRVLGTKVDGALNLLRLVRGDSLKFTALFSSIAGRFGNVGQSDYAAANECLNKLAHWLDRRWPGRVVSIIWGPWSGVGMVSQLESHLGNRGLGMISPESGGSLLINELRHGRKGEVEVIYSGELGTLEQPITGASLLPERAEVFSS